MNPGDVIEQPGETYSHDQLQGDLSLANALARALKEGTLPSDGCGRPDKPPPTCDKCDGAHPTDACPHFKKAREDHVDAKAGPALAASLDARRHRFCVVFHQVRHPLRVISSVVRATRAHDRFWDWLYGVEPGLDRTDPPVRRAARLWLLQNRRLEKIADARFLVEETSPRAVCSAAGFPDFLCRGDGRHHATSSKVVQPILEPRRLARSEALRVPSKVPAVSWADVERLDAALAAACRDLAAAYGYDADPRYHPQSLDTTAFKA